MRIVTLLPSATEIVAALGAQDAIVGRSHECDYPPGVEALPVCTAPRRPMEGTAAEINAVVAKILEDALSVYEVDTARLSALKPDVIVTQTQCEVCAVSERDVLDAIREGLDATPALVSLGAADLDGLWADIRAVARALGCESDGVALIGRLTNRLEAVTATYANVPRRPRVACIEWTDPLMGAGNWVPELVHRAGGEDVLGEAGAHSGWLEFETLAAAEPDIIVFMPCGYSLDAAAHEGTRLIATDTWPDLSAVRNQAVYAVDANQYFNRPGPRLVESLEIMAELLHPSGIRYGHEKAAWRRL